MLPVKGPADDQFLYFRGETMKYYLIFLFLRLRCAFSSEFVIYSQFLLVSYVLRLFDQKTEGHHPYGF